MQIRRLGDHRHGALQVEQYQLPNGLMVIYLPDPMAPVFSLQTWFRVGSGHERAGRTGMAHLFEHLMFKGTERNPEGTFDRLLEAVGARINAGTWLDWTFYYEAAPRGHLELVLRLEADRMEHMILNAEQLEAEREVVINERRERVDNDPAGKLSELLWAEAFAQHPYRNPTIGWMDDIRALTLEDCLSFHRTYYAPNNAVLVVVGDVDRAELLALVERYYGHMERQPVPELAPAAEPEQAEPRRLEVELALSAERLVIGYRSPSVTDPDHVVLGVLNEVLFEGDSARLQRDLVTDGEIASGVGAFVSPFRFPGLYEISVDLRPGRTAEEAEQVILAAFARLLAEGISEAELEKARNRIETGFYRQLQTVQQKAQGLGFWETTAGDFRRLFTVADAYKAVTRADVARVAARVLRPEARTVVIARPLPAKP